MDIGVLGKGKSDPYAIITVGAQQFKTDVINNTVNPKWDYWCEVCNNVYFIFLSLNFSSITNDMPFMNNSFHHLNYLYRFESHFFLLNA